MGRSTVHFFNSLWERQVMADLREEFENPGSVYRGKPFWAWNGKLEEAELRRQIRAMHRMGLGGFFMHSRVGLATPYLSDEWFRMIDACVDEARKLGMEAWLYDEDRWPSGAAGGLVTGDPKYRHRNLFMVECDPEDARFQREPLALFSARIESIIARNVRRLSEPEEAEDGAKVLAFFVRADEPSSWFNDATYLDTMSHEAVARFIEVTHEAYRRENGEDFGAVVPGIFTDEPHHGPVFTAGTVEGREAVGVPWTGEFPRHFRERYGYDILDHLPHIFFKVDGAELSPQRHHYHDCATFLFVDAFARQIFEWCQENDLKSTGHVLAESSLISQSRVGGAAMRFYEFMQAPGIDILTEHNYQYTTAKQCSSVLHQTGRRWMLSELYGCTGWDWPFEGHKAGGDWQAALGVNLRCQHLSWYTMAGQAKRDYPASIHYQSPWWERYGCVEDYFARVNTVISRGEPVRRLLVVHPVESVWARSVPGWQDADARIGELDDAFGALTRWLLDRHLDFDYGDEEMMSRMGALGSGGPATIRVGEAEYSAVLVPPVDTLRSTTLDLLERFADAGGELVFCEPLPAWVDAERSERAAELAERCRTVPFQSDAVSDALAGTRSVSIRGPEGEEKAGVLYSLHRDGDELRLFLCNTDRRNPTGPLTIGVEGAGNVQLWDAETGERYAVEAGQGYGVVRFWTEMPPTGSRLFVITPRDEALPPLPEYEDVRRSQIPDDAWTAELTDFNVLVLDRPEYRVDGGDWAGPLEILKADAEVRRAIDLPLRGGRMVQPWVRKEEEGPAGRVELRYRLAVTEPPSGPLFLALESPEYFRIALNGNSVSMDAECGWWTDRSIRTIPLDAAALVAGQNELLLTATVDADCNLETCFLLGDFCVEVEAAEAHLTGGAPQVGPGDWTLQGLPFYAGSVVFRAALDEQPAEDEHVFVQVPEFGGACVRVLVNGERAGVVGWPPYEVEVTPLVRGADAAELAVEVVAHRRNAFGPLHHTESHPRWTGPGQFVSTGDQWQEAYNLVPAGLLGSPRVAVRRKKS